MILTGKAKEDFIIWLNNLEVAPYEVMLDNIPKSYLYALIIEWLDSVLINVNIENLKYQSWWYFKIKYCPETYNEAMMVETRQRATENAIKKANEIYNKTHS